MICMKTSRTEIYKTCDRLRDGFLYLLENYTSGEYAEVQEITHRTMQPVGIDLLVRTF